ncbi:MAG: hypothetical protein HY548_06750, partial [Elusimicrobia bacterium]|nr:hypothetical protein [Elusimicrobiota bacterium]
IVGVLDPDVLAPLPQDWKRWVKVRDDKKKLRGVIEGLRRDVDVVMVLAHSGLDADQRMAEEIPGIDLVVGGHSQTLMKEPLRVENLKSGTSAWIVQAGGNGQYVGKVLVRVKPDKTVALENYELIPLTEDIEDDPGLLSLLPR